MRGEGGRSRRTCENEEDTSRTSNIRSGVQETIHLSPLESVERISQVTK